jgi:hypothetical protein
MILVIDPRCWNQNESWGRLFEQTWKQTPVTIASECPRFFEGQHPDLIIIGVKDTLGSILGSIHLYAGAGIKVVVACENIGKELIGQALGAGAAMVIQQTNNWALIKEQISTVCRMIS